MKRELRVDLIDPLKGLLLGVYPELFDAASRSLDEKGVEGGVSSPRGLTRASSRVYEA